MKINKEEQVYKVETDCDRGNKNVIIKILEDRAWVMSDSKSDSETTLWETIDWHITKHESIIKALKQLKNES